MGGEKKGRGSNVDYVSSSQPAVARVGKSRTGNAGRYAILVGEMLDWGTLVFCCGGGTVFFL